MVNTVEPSFPVTIPGAVATRPALAGRISCPLAPGKKKARTSVRAKERPLAEDVTTPHNTAQNECRIPIRTSACVCVVDGVKL